MSAEICSIDVETAAVVSVEDRGAAAYARHYSFFITCMAWAFGAGEIKSVQRPTALPDEVLQHILAGGIIRGWNLDFEANALEQAFGVTLAPEQLDDTQARAMYHGLAASLDDTGNALRLDILKDKKARTLMLQMARPRANKDGVLRWWHDEDQAKLDALTAYCVRDVAAERAIADVLPPLPAQERRTYQMTHVINNRGIKFDLPLIAKMRAIAEESVAAVNDRAAELSGGFITSPGTQSGRMKQFFAGAGITSFAKGVMPDHLARTDLTPAQREMLELRALSAKSSTAKLETIEAYADAQGIVRGTLKYYGAHSGRYSSKGPQIQNLPRGSIKNPDDAINSIMAGMDSKGLSHFYGSPMEVLSSCIRGTIIPRPGNVLIGLDYSQIEARITAFAAGQEDQVEVFRRGDDIYTYAAEQIGLPDRQSGKAATLGLGFGCGVDNFITFAAGYGLTLTEEESKAIVYPWREANSKIVSTWYALADAAFEAVRIAKSTKSCGATIKVNEWFTMAVRPAHNGAPVLMMKIPGGRVLYYRDVEIVQEERFGRMRDSLVCSGVNIVTKKWVHQGIRLYAGKFYENAVQGWAANIMISAMRQIKERQLGEVVMSIHDEIVAEAPEHLAQERYEQIAELMSTTPDWCGDLPLAVDGAIMRRFKK